MDLDVVLTPRAITAESLRGRAVVVVDVLRAGSTIVTALANGARAVIPAADVGEAGRLASTMDADVLLLGGERGGKALAGYGAGNSPAEYALDAVRDRTVVLTTTNGTPSIALARHARALAVGSFLNLSAAADFLRQHLRNGQAATILCAGDDGRVALEDTLCAGRIATHVLASDGLAGEAAALSDGTQIAIALDRGSRGHLARALFRARHTQALLALGAAADVTYCARIDALDALPVRRDNLLVLAS